MVVMAFLDSASRSLLGKDIQDTFLWKVYKWIAHRVTGNCEIERICGSKALQGVQARALERSLLRSRTLVEVRKELNNPDFDIKLLADRIIAIKQINEKRSPQVVASLQTSLLLLRNARAAFHALQTQARTPYDSDSPQHEAMLQELWSLLRPDIRRNGGRITLEWQEIGFQGKDPATDFRGMGVLALNNLIYLCKKAPETAHTMLTNSHNPAHEYPFAATGINITALVLAMLGDRTFSYHFYDKTSPQDCLAAFNDLYVLLFCRFDELWVKSRPSNVMAFGAVFASFKKHILADPTSLHLTPHIPKSKVMPVAI